MSTAEELEKLKEPGKFELLATAVLCKAERNYRGILHSGLNAQSQPIKSPVDGFCRVSDSYPPHFILVEHTVEVTLEKKWLFDHRTVKPAVKARKKRLSESDDGDLLKAGRLAQQIKAELPDAKFTVVLTTNQGLKPDFCLKVEKKAEELGVSVDFWDRSRIARFLDAEPEGQWLRKEYLGLDAEILSEPLLRDLCCKSLNEYQKQFLTSPDRWVSRQIDQKAEAAIENQSCSIHLLVGNSGSGKSAAAYQAGKKYLEAGGYSLWLSENTLTVSDSLTSALDKALHDLCPSLMPDAGETALRLLKGRKRILLIGDDVNRTSSPAALLQKLVNWSKPLSSSDSDAKAAPSKHLLMCPAWSDIVRSVTPDVDKTPWISSIFVGTMTLEEGLEAVQDAVSSVDLELTNLEASILAEKLGNDPVLIGFFASLVTDVQPNELNQLAENVVDSFINRAIEDVSRTGALLSGEYRSALLSLTTQMLQRRKFNPLLTEIKAWFGNTSEEWSALRDLTKHGKLCRDEENRLIFRHDRLREALLIESMGQLLNDATEPLDIFWEPYYAEIIGQAIVQYPQSEEFLEELCDRIPLALIEAMRYINPFSDDHHQKIIHRIQKWINANTESNNIPRSMLSAISVKLVEIDSPFVLEITKLLSEERLTLLARLRNGCAISGIKLCIHQNRRFFAPCSDSLRDQVLEHVKHRYKEKISIEIKQVMTSTESTDEIRAGALTLIGFLGLSNFEEEIAICWQCLEDRKIIIPMALWAAIKCSGLSSLQTLDNLFIYWSKLSSDQDKDSISQQNWFIARLSGALGGKLEAHIISHLIQQAKKHENLKIYIMRILDMVDTPDAVEFVVNSMTEIQQSLPELNQVFTYGIRLQDIWGESSQEKKQLSQKSLEKLQSIWENSENNNCLKYNAFFLWLLCATTKHLKNLQRVSHDSTLFKQAIYKRLELGDFSAVQKLVYVLSCEPVADSSIYWYWFAKLHHVWCPELMDVIDQYINAVKYDFPQDFAEVSIYQLSEKQLNTHDYIADLLLRIPKKDAETLLIKYWNYFKYTFLYVDAALMIGTPKCLAIIRDSIVNRPPSVGVLSHIGSYSIHAEFSDRINRSYLNRLLTYLKYLEKDELEIIAIICQRLSIPDWGRKHLIKYMTLQSQERFYPSDETLIQNLDNLSQKNNLELRVSYWLGDLHGKQIPKRQILDVIDKLLDFTMTLERFKAVALCIGTIGTRSDNSLAILDKFEIDNLSDEISNIKASTQFDVYRRTLD